MIKNEVKVTNETKNLAVVSGVIIKAPILSHSVYGENFYTFYIEVKRLSDTYDEIPVLVSDRLIEIENLKVNTYIKLEGQIRSYNNYSKEENKNKLLLTVFTKNIEILQAFDFKENDTNEIELDGFICKDPIYRTTPFGREICDMLLAVNRNYNKSDYIPCISWGRNAKFAENFKVGDNIKLIGRVQSRKYQKKLSETEVLEKTAYEISINKMEVVKEN